MDFLDTAESTSTLRSEAVYTIRQLEGCVKNMLEMKLLISDEVMWEILYFSRQSAGSEPLIEQLKIVIPMPSLSLTLFQPERYDQTIGCYLDFKDGVGFFFEEVYSAIEGQKNSEQVLDDRKLAIEDVKKHNDNYVCCVIAYCKENFEILTSVPPNWFRRAVEISDAATRKYFPDLADDDLRKKQALFESWGMPVR